jgi:hypothetical protein
MPGAENGPLAAEVPGVRGISIIRQAGTVCVSLQVDAHQPAGQFRGSINSNGREVGTLMVTIEESSGESW